MMGGLMFIGAVILCLLIFLPSVKDFSVYYVLLLSLCFGAVGFVDDFCKMKKKKNEGLTSIQKLLLQLAVVIAVVLAYRGKSLLTVSVAASAAVMVTEWVLTLFA